MAKAGGVTSRMTHVRRTHKAKGRVGCVVWNMVPMPPHCNRQFSRDPRACVVHVSPVGWVSVVSRPDHSCDTTVM